MSSPPGRIGIGAAFRQSIHPINVRADLKALPKLVDRQGAVHPGRHHGRLDGLWSATGANELADPTCCSPTSSSRPRSAASSSPGFLAPRASWLLG